ncbi:MAG TPA: hypothetical protein EYP59_10550 [Thiotrichaceae bacterium]|nr:hypothetical protein [Thiotrichaceae bacterium]
MVGFLKFDLNDPEQDAPAIIKRYYRWDCVMGLFLEKGNAPEDWEIKAVEMHGSASLPSYWLTITEKSARWASIR